MNLEMLESFPPPPPWRKEVDDTTAQVVFVNDVTGEKTNTHPLLVHLQKEACLRDESKEESHEDEAPLEFPDDKRQEEFCGGDHLDFRCEWKEIGLKGNIMSYGMTLRYFLEDKHFELAFDGVDATWKYSKLDGKYGPLDKYDLYIGSQITLFGRHLSISSTNCDICRMIDTTENKMKKKRAYLQDKIEMVGAIPIVKRASQDRIRDITRSSSKTGHGNLRQLRNEILKLSEQMGSLGISHLVK